MPTRRAGTTAAVLAALFLFRLGFGLSSDFFAQDETQIYLSGLRYYATGQWPYFGPDVVWTDTQVAGALQPLLVGWPFKVLPIPEAPYIVLNLLSTAALALLGWYICQRVTSIPGWLAWGWIFTVPWTLQFSTHINNASYVLPASVVFFVGFLEAFPWLRAGVIPVRLACFMMGAAVAWLMQIHMSWPLCLPYVLAVYLVSWRESAPVKQLALNAAALAAGAVIPGLLLLPTLMTYGAESGEGLRNVQLHWVNPMVAVTTLARFFSFASLEIVRFVGFDTATRLQFLQRHIWLVPFGIVVWLAGIIQPIWMLREWLRPRSAYPEWPIMKVLIAATVLLVYVADWFVIERATEAHAFYLLAPLALIFAAYCWSFIDSPRWRRVAALLLACNVVFHAGLGVAQAPAKSLYRHRDVVSAAIAARDPEILGHRRPFANDGGPARLSDPGRPYDPRSDIRFERVSHSVDARGVIVWTLTLRNTSAHVAYRDVLCETTYRNASGETVEAQRTFITDILQPGDVRSAELNDGVVEAPFTDAGLALVTAEALVPALPYAAAR